MHELGLVIDLVEMVSDYAVQNDIRSVSKVVLRVGEGFSVVPQAMLSIYQNAIEGTVLAGSKLELETVSASAVCHACAHHFNPLHTNGQCDACGSDDYTVTAGKEFEIKEIVVPNE